MLVNILAARITAGVSSCGLHPTSRTHFIVGFLLWAGESQVTFGDGGAVKRDNIMVRALCPVGRRVAKEDLPQDLWAVWAGGKQAEATVLRGLSHLASAHCQPGLW